MYRTECTMYDEVSVGNPGKVPYCNERNQFEPDCTNCERHNVTKADKIRSMTDEELAHTLWLTAKGGIIGQRSEDEWLNWLKREDE